MDPRECSNCGMCMEESMVDFFDDSNEMVVSFVCADCGKRWKVRGNWYKIDDKSETMWEELW